MLLLNDWHEECCSRAIGLNNVETERLAWIRLCSNVWPLFFFAARALFLLKPWGLSIVEPEVCFLFGLVVFVWGYVRPGRHQWLFKSEWIRNTIWRPSFWMRHVHDESVLMQIRIYDRKIAWSGRLRITPGETCLTIYRRHPVKIFAQIILHHVEWLL